MCTLKGARGDLVIPGSKMNHLEVPLETFLSPESILFFDQVDQKEVIEELFKTLHPPLEGFDLLQIQQKIFFREHLSSTCIGSQIAIPHLKVQGLERFYLALGIHKEGIEWGAIDGMAVRLILLILGPEVDPIHYLNFLSNLTKRLKNHKLKEKLLGSSSPQEAYQIFMTEDESWI